EIKGFIKTPLRKKPGVAQRNKQEERKGEIVTFKKKKNENTSDTGNAMVTLTNTSRFVKKVAENDETTEEFVQDSSWDVSDFEDSSCDSDSTDSDAAISKGRYNEREVQMEVQLYAQVKARNIIESALNALGSNIENHQNVAIDEQPTPDISSTYAKDDKIGSTSSSVSVSSDLSDIRADNTPLMVQETGKPYAMVLHELCKRIRDSEESDGTTITSKAQLHFDNRTSNEARNEDISDQMQIIARNKTDLIPKEASNSVVENKSPEKKMYSANLCQKEKRKQDEQK
ncbi:hypothetical protein MAR_009258, partial [Mya arenaria]